MLLGLGEEEYEYYDANEGGEDVNIDFIDDQSLEDFVNDNENEEDNETEENEETKTERENDKVLNYLENEDTELVMKKSKKYMRKQRRKNRRHESKLI